MLKISKLSLFLCIILPILLLAIFSFIRVKNQMIDRMETERKSIATLSANIVHEKLDHLLDIGRSLASRPIFKRDVKEGKWKEAVSLVKEIPQAFNYLSEILVSDSAGHIMGGPAMESSGWDSLNKEQTRSNWYEGVHQNWKPYLSEVYMADPKIGKTVFDLALPIPGSDGLVYGILVLQVDVAKLLEWKSNIGIEKSGSIYIVDQHGHLILQSAPQTGDSTVKVRAVPLAQEILYGKGGKEGAKLSDESPSEISAYGSVPVYGWTTIVRQDKEAISAFRSSLRNVGIFYAGVILLAAFLAIMVIRETSRRKYSEKALMESETSNRLLLDNIRDYAIFRLDPEGNVVSWNEGARSLKGYEETEILHQSIETFYPQDKIISGEPKANLDLAKKHGQIEQQGWRVRKDGSLFWADVILTALKDDQGNLIGFTKITRDITDRKLVLEKLETLNRQIEQSNDAIILLDRDRRITHWNQGAEKTFGFSMQEAIGNDNNELLRTVFGEGEPEKLEKSLLTRNYWTGELKKRKKSGEEIIVNASITKMHDEFGQITGFVVVNVDITEKKALRREIEQIANLVDHSSEAIITRRIDQTILTWNKGAEVLFGYSKEEAIGKLVSDLGFAQLNRDEIKEIEKHITMLGSWKGERNFFHRDGTPFWCSVTGNGVKDEFGDTTDFIFIIKDINQRKMLEDKLNKLNEELEQKVKERTKEVSRNEKKFRSLVENNLDIIALLDNEFSLVYLTPASERISGWKDEELMHRSISDIVHPDDLLKTKEDFFTTLRNPLVTIPIRFRARHRDGHFILMEGVAINLLKDENVQGILFNLSDVTERYAAQEKLAVSELRFRKLIENSAEGISLLDESGNVLYRSPSALHVIGSNPRSNTLSLAYPDDIQLFQNKFQEALSNPGVPVKYLLRYWNSNGFYFWTEGIFTNLLNVPGVDAIVANYRDVTDRVETEKKLISSELRFRSLIENSSDGITLSDAEFNTFYRSPSSIKILGRNSFVNLIHFVHPDDQGIARRVREDALAKPGVPISYQIRLLHSDGLYKWLEGTLTNLLHVSGVEAIVGNFSDITQRKQVEEAVYASEERYRTFLERVTDAFIALDKNWNYTYLNQQAGTLIHRDPQALIGKNVWEVFPDAVGSGTYQAFHQAMKEQTVIVNVDYYGPLDLWQENHIYPSENGLSIFIRDITKTRKAELELAKNKSEEQKKITKAILFGQERERNTMAQELHDNVNQILAGTNLYLSLAKSKPSGRVHHIDTAIQNIQLAIEENRKIAHALVTPDFESIKLTEQICNLCNQMLHANGVSVEVDAVKLDDNLLDEERKLAIYRIVQEQTSNIVKYAHAKLVTIHLLTTGELFHMRIVDDGQGMETGKTANGIGLRNIKSRLGIFNGSVSIHSSPGMGFVMEVTIPLAKAEYVMMA